MKNFNFYHFDSDPRFPQFLLYVRWKSGVTFVRRCFRDAESAILFYFVNSLIPKDRAVKILLLLAKSKEASNYFQNGAANYIPKLDMNWDMLVWMYTHLDHDRSLLYG